MENQTAQLLKIKVENMTSPRSNRPVPNQFVIYTEHGQYFQSYKTVIAFKNNDGKVFLDPRWNYSVTTNKYRNEFLGNGTEDVRKLIKDGTYTVINLN